MLWGTARRTGRRFVAAAPVTSSSRSTRAAWRACSTHVGEYEAAFRTSVEDPETMWKAQADTLKWDTPYTSVLSDSAQHPAGYAWFQGGKLNTSVNCLDVHVAAGRGEWPALIFDSAISGEVTTFTYAELLAQVETFAGALRNLGVGYGDTVVLYMPMVPEAAIAMLACTRIGAVHSVVFGGFAAHELAVRIDDAKPKVVVSASCGLEGADKVLPYKPLLDEALRQSSHQPQRCVILQRPQATASLEAGRDMTWADAVATVETGADPVAVASTDPSYILYTSGTTGQPKGVVRDTAGHMVALKYSMDAVYGMNPGDVWWAASDVGWVVGHSYIVYAPLLAGCASVLFEGKPVGTPDAGTFWRTVRRHNVRTMFTAPTALRVIRKEDPHGDLLRSIGLGDNFDALYLAGERSDPETVAWAQEQLNVPVIDHYWQTESGWPIIANCRGYGLHATKRGSSTKPVPGWDVKVLHPDHTPSVDTGEVHIGEDGLQYAPPNTLGPLVVKLPLPPGATGTLWNDPARFRASYLDLFPGYYHSGDAATVDDDGYIDIMSRTDDVMNVAGHRLSTGAIEAAIATHPAVAEAAVIGPMDAIKGQVPVALIVLKDGVEMAGEDVVAAVVAAVRDQVGPIAAFKQAVIVSRLPKTRSGKTLRATMKAIADGATYKVPATIDDPTVLPEIETALATLGYASSK